MRLRVFSLPATIAVVLSSQILAADPKVDAAAAAKRMRADVKYLSGDRLEGRGPGTRGEELATEYIAGEFKKAGLTPMGRRGSYFQPVPLIRVTTDSKATLSASAGDRAHQFPLRR